MRLTGIDAYAIRIPSGAAEYDTSPGSQALEPRQFETALVRVRTDSGATGWGEASAPVAPEVVCAVVDHILANVLRNAEFAGEPAEIEDFWNRMYASMRVRGHTGGYQLDAIAAVDIALWDLAGKIAGKPVSALLYDWPRESVRAYFDGVTSVAGARKPWDEGFRHLQLTFDAGEGALWRTYDALRDELGPEAELSVDARWRLDWNSATAFGQKLDERSCTWLENPLMPEFPVAHGLLSSCISTKLAIGSCHRTRQELEPFFQQGGMRWVQPDVGHTGLTEGMSIARLASSYCMGLAPDIGGGLGPRTAAALHFAAAAPDCLLAQYRPGQLEASAPYLADPFRLERGKFIPPQGPGLGIAFNDAFREICPQADAAEV